MEEKPSSYQFGWDVANGIFLWLGADRTWLSENMEAVEDEEEVVELLVLDLAAFVYIFMWSKRIWGQLFIVDLLDGLDHSNAACHRWYRLKLGRRRCHCSDGVEAVNDDRRR
ncbi:hypothetical protein ACLOJK_038254 [Asimina triloba]